MSTKPGFYLCIDSIGGGIGAVDKLKGAPLQDKEAILAFIGTEFIPYHLDANSGAAENDPLVISPDEDAGNKRWILSKGVFAGLISYGKLQVESNTFPVIRSVRTIAVTDGIGAALDIVLKTNGDMVDGFGGGVVSSIQDDTVGPTYTAGFYGVRTGADNSGSFCIYTNNAGSWTEKVRVLPGGGVVTSALKSGTDQANAGAAANELYHDTDENSIRIGV